MGDVIFQYAKRGTCRAPRGNRRSVFHFPHPGGTTTTDSKVLVDNLMQSELKRDWDSTEWEQFALRLVQVRHGPHSVQQVPDNVRGDAGIEFLTTEGYCYQCYAPAQSADTAKAASAMKQKATRDLRKLNYNASTIEELLGTRKLTRWILLCPFLDDKSVISHIRAKTDAFSIPTLKFVSEDFHALVQSLHDFENELTTLRSLSRGIPINMQLPSSEQTSIHFRKVGTQIDTKLERGFPNLRIDLRNKRAREYTRAHLLSENALEQLKYEFPELWEAYRRALTSEEIRLQTVGSGSGDASEQLNRELERLETKFSRALPSLDSVTITTLSTGTLATWLIECPLDFHSDAGELTK